MARDEIDLLLAKAKEHEKIAKHLRESARLLRGLASPVEGIAGGQPIRRPDAWTTADDIEILLDYGAKSMREQELIDTLVDRGMVKGLDRDIRIAAARRALTRGVTIGYLEIRDGIVHWIPNVRVNTRLARRSK